MALRTRDLALLPIGSIARLERWSEKPAQELLIAPAGPAVTGHIGEYLLIKETLKTHDIHRGYV